MSEKRLALKAFVWATSISSLFVLILTAGLIALIVGEWSYQHTGDERLAVWIGVFVLMGFLSSLGTAVGIWVWTRRTTDEESVKADTSQHVLAEISTARRE